MHWMIDRSAKFVLIAFFVLLNNIIIAPALVKAQEFPYVAPSAPEFDGRGNLVRDATRPSQLQTGQARVSSQGNVQPDMSTSINTYAVRPSPTPKPVVAPQTPYYSGSQDLAPKPRRQASYPQSPDNRQATSGSTPLASAPTQAMPEPTQRQDCSHFPMLIANSRSEAEMQMTARRYLTCLIQNGWNMDQARQHVISTIESTYRLAR